VNSSYTAIGNPDNLSRDIGFGTVANAQHEEITMTLLDGLDYYKTYSDSDWEFTLKVQSLALEVLDLISVYGDHPDSRALELGSQHRPHGAVLFI
jgi:hypothetical protein